MSYEIIVKMAIKALLNYNFFLNNQQFIRNLF